MLIKKQKLVRKKFFLMVFLLIVTIFCFNLKKYAYCASIVNKIIKLEKRNQRLNEQIINKLRFKLNKNKTFGGETCKYLLEEKESKDLWLFKIYNSSVPVNSTIVTYRLAQLLGIDISEITMTTLIINEKKQYGSIQKIMPGVKKINEISFNELSSKQIETIMKNQVLDWLVFNTDIDGDEFLVEEKTGKIIAIDKDETFFDEESGLLMDNQGDDSYYYEFWKAYLKGECSINSVNFRKVFELIDYFQNIHDKHIKCIIKGLMVDVVASYKLDFIIEKVISRKHNLKVDFENFYKDLIKGKGFFFQIPPIDRENTYAHIIAKRLKKRVFEKEEKLSQLMLKKLEKEENIKRISCSDAWFLIEDLNYANRKDFFSLAVQTIKKLKALREKKVSIYEQFVIELYIEQIKNFQKRREIENFISWEIDRIILYPEQMTDAKILRIESNLRSNYGKKRKKFSEYKQDIEKNPKNFLLHLDYIQYPIEKTWNEEEKLILEEYNERLEKNPTDLIYKVLYGMLLKDIDFLKKIDDNFSWKYLAMGIIYTFKDQKNRAIEECNKVLVCKDKKETIFLAYMLLGFLYELDCQFKKPAEGFLIKQALIAYKKALMINPESVKAHLNLGILYLKMENLNKAIDEFKIVNKLDYKYGKKHFHFKKIKNKNKYKNMKEYIQAVKMNTLSGRHNYILGLACLIKGNKNLAQRHFDKAREFGYESF